MSNIKITPTSPLAQSKDLLSDNIAKLQQLFPEAFTEGKIDFEALQNLLGDHVEDKEERYNFTWAGKQQAMREAQKMSRGTLRPAKSDSVDWDTTQNLYIEGDNLEVLKLLQKSYHSKVKMIYIDPPYNTGKDFVYKDNYKDNLQNYKEITGQVGEDGARLSTNSDTAGRYHSNWLNMMYPRLKLARNLLKEDGVIFISIDDNEVTNLRRVCDEIFGEDNFVANVIWERAFSPKNDAKYISENHDHVVIYSKSKENFVCGRLERSAESLSRYKNPDNDLRGKWTSGDLSVKTYNESYDYQIKTPSGKFVNPPHGSCWRVSKERFAELVSEDRIWFGANGDNVPRLKRFLSDVQDGVVPISIWSNKEVGHNQEGRQELKATFDGQGFFDGPKPVRLLRRVFKVANISKSDLILDFFSGSATTAHATMQLNAEDGGKRKFIMVQLPEPTPEKSEARKAGYETICEIGKERIRRAGQKIKEENPIATAKLDTGFKVLKLDSSNIKSWDPNYEELGNSLFDAVDNIKEDRTNADLAYEVLLKYGLDLTLPIHEVDLNGHKLFDVGMGALLLCMEKNIDSNLINSIVKYAEDNSLIEDEQAEKIKRNCRVIFRDTGFIDDTVKANALKDFERIGITEVRSI